MPLYRSDGLTLERIDQPKFEKHEIPLFSRPTPPISHIFTWRQRVRSYLRCLWTGNPGFVLRSLWCSFSWWRCTRHRFPVRFERII